MPGFGSAEGSRGWRGIRLYLPAGEENGWEREKEGQRGRHEGLWCDAPSTPEPKVARGDLIDLRLALALCDEPRCTEARGGSGRPALVANDVKETLAG